jgi:general secretion pathway protein M
VAWRPLAASNQQLADRNERAQETLQWMHNAAATVKSARKNGGKKASGVSLNQLLDTSVQKHQLKFSRFQPRGNNRAQVWFDGANFAKLFVWLDELDKQGVAASNVSITATREAGLVSATLQLQKQ